MGERRNPKRSGEDRVRRSQIRLFSNVKYLPEICHILVFSLISRFLTSLEIS